MSLPTKNTPALARRDGAREDAGAAARGERRAVEGQLDARFELIALGEDAAQEDFASAVREGLAGSPKRLAYRHFYDSRGSRLFEEICELPEYYLTRAELEILARRAPEIASMLPTKTTLVELGSGNARKTRTLISAFLERHGALRYVPVDISRTALEQSARALLDEYPALRILALAGEYGEGLKRLGRGSAPILVLWLGSSVGNFTHGEAVRFLAGVASRLTPADRMLVGADLRKSTSVLLRAYDDAAGVTARFNLNLLARINRELDGRFELQAFRHEARWNETAGCVEMHLVSTRAQSVAIGALGCEFSFAAGESIHTESSHKYSLPEIEGIAAAAGLTVERCWLDDAARFSLSMLAPTGARPLPPAH